MGRFWAGGYIVRLPREVVDFFFSGDTPNPAGCLQYSLLYGACFAGGGVGLSDLQRSLAAPTVL